MKEWNLFVAVSCFLIVHVLVYLCLIYLDSSHILSNFAELQSKRERTEEKKCALQETKENFYLILICLIVKYKERKYLYLNSKHTCLINFRL